MKNPIDIERVLTTIRKADSILVTTHAGPDGDAIGSALGVYLLAKALDKQNLMLVCHDEVPHMYAWLDGAEAFRRPDDVSGEFDLAIITDVAQFERCGDVERHLKNSGGVMVLDHHLEEDPDGDLHCMDSTYASASELILDIIEASGVSLSRAMAECLYVGLATDTGGFRYGNTNPGAHRRAAKLLEAGVQVAPLSTRVFDHLSPAKLDLLGRVLDRMNVSDDGRVASSYLTQADMDDTQASAEDVEGLVNYARNRDGVTVGILFREIDGGKKIKVSMRSADGFNSARVLNDFGGGGHAGAAGATMETTREAAMHSVLDAVHAAINGKAP